MTAIEVSFVARYARTKTPTTNGKASPGLFLVGKNLIANKVPPIKTVRSVRMKRTQEDAFILNVSIKVAANTQIYIIRCGAQKNIAGDNVPVNVIHFLLLLGLVRLVIIEPVLYH